uniref:TALPID3 protein-like n=1 Tax=Phallusia mammillata TaxID=59560 RepID=A0A6F9DGC8_9ASCI|nr:TALPID3 protein-like [Phallusia mammillata]
MSKPCIPQGIEKDVAENFCKEVNIQKYDETSVRKCLSKVTTSKMNKSKECIVHPETASRGIKHHYKWSQDEKITSDLKEHVGQLTEKLELLAKHPGLLDKHDLQKHVYGLETQLTDITNQRLQHLEVLQQHQTQWQSQFLKALEKIHYDKVSQSTGGVLEPPHKRLDLTTPVSSLTPLPRNTVPQPSQNVDQGNGHFLEEILRVGNRSNKSLDVSCCDQIELTPVRDTTVSKKNSSSDKTMVEDLISANHKIRVKELEKQLQKEEISKQFPSSISEYLLKSPPPVEDTDVLGRIQIIPTIATDCKTLLKKITQARCTLDDNIKHVQHSIAADLKPCTVGNNHLDNGKLCMDNKWHIKQLVDDKIAALSEEKTLNQELKTHQKNQVKTKNPLKTKQQTKRLNPESNNKLGPSQSANNPSLGRTKPFKAVSKKQADVKVDEDAATHMFGRAAYHVRRTTVQKPFMHVTTPHSKPKFRTKRAIENISATYKRSEKSQASLLSNKQPMYYFDPTSCHLEQNQVASGNLIPVAVSLRPPKIFDTNVVPVIIPKPKAKSYVSIPTATPQLEALKKSTDAQEEASPVICVSQGNEKRDLTSSESEEVEHNHEVKLDGQAKEKIPCSNNVSYFTPIVEKPEPKKIQLKANLFEEETKDWMEKEILSRILSQLYGNASQEPPTSCDPPLLIDSGNEYDEETMNKLIESEIEDIIRNMMGKKDVAPKKPKTITFLPDVPISIFQPATPVPTPIGTPTSRSDDDFRVDVPRCKTPELSVSEISFPSSHSEPEVWEEEQQLVQSDSIRSVATPEITPPISLKDPIESVHSEKSFHRSASPQSEETSLESIPDPWDGETPQESNIHHTMKRPCILYPPVLEEEIHEIVERIPQVVASPTTYSDSSLSESTSKGIDATISDGQLVISHGELKPKVPAVMKLKEIDDLGTLRGMVDLQDENDQEPSSEGEIRTKGLPRSQFHRNDPQHEDPNGIYERPRKHRQNLPSDDEDLSVGELAPRHARQERFNKWKKRRSPVVSALEQDSSLQDESTIDGDSSISSLVNPQVIVVTPVNKSA